MLPKRFLEVETDIGMVLALVSARVPRNCIGRDAYPSGLYDQSTLDRRILGRP